MEFLFAIADRAKLRAAGDALPSTGPFTLYRGVAGIGRARRIRGWSWTASLPIAQWFATRSFHLGAPKPAVYTITIEEPNILVYSNERTENEFIVRVPRTVKILRVRGLSFESLGNLPEHEGGHHEKNH